MTPVVTVTPRLEQEFRYDQLFEHLGNDASLYNSDHRCLRRCAHRSSGVNPALPPYFSALVAQGLNLQSPSTMVVVAQEIGRQAQMLAFNNLFWFLGWFAIAMLPLLLVMKRPEKVGLVMA